MDYANLNARSFEPLLKWARLPNIRFHDLRHTCATHLLSKGGHPKVVADVLEGTPPSRSRSTRTPTSYPTCRAGRLRDRRHPFPALLARQPETRFRETAATLRSP